MCGLAGFFLPQGFAKADALATLTRMRDTLVHRGPDDAGVWLDSDAGIAMGHRRLAVLDLSPAGHQPMVSATGRYVLVFNGEIYNHLDMRRQVEDADPPQSGWRGHSDTETLLAAIEQWGLQRTLQRCIGMFALALWDRQERRLSLARDRLGEKPLYFGWQGKALLFGSELKALQAHPAFRSEIHRDALPLYLRHGYIPAPWSIWKGIQKLSPGCLVQLIGKDFPSLPQPQPYWSLADNVVAGQVDPFSGTDDEAIDALEQQLGAAIGGQMVADVPLGAFLSGGIDSSTVVALMQAQSRRPVKTFTIGFDAADYNEAEHAKAVARHLGTEHTELYVTALQARDVLPRLSAMYDEPFGDSSAIPTHLVSKLAKQHVTVSLSGDGGDELFGGYDRYHKTENIWNNTRGVPAFLRGFAAAALRSPVVSVADSAMQTSATAMGRPLSRSLLAQTTLAADLMDCDEQRIFYRTMTSQWNHPPVAQKGLDLIYGASDTLLASMKEPVQKMMAIDSLAYLPDDILAKVDRAAMAVSLETRVPLLDHRVVELAWRMPYKMKVRHGQGKWLLRQVLYRHVPRALLERPKMGFGVPVDEWLRGPLREWAEDLLDEDRLKAQGFLDPKPIRARWHQHLKGHHNWRDSLWLVLMWQTWLQGNDINSKGAIMGLQF
jgi:asparagine synthase (glutamine-hydrolysing)